MDRDADLVREEAHRGRLLGVDDAIDDLHLEEVVARADRAALVAAALDRALAQVVGLRLVDAAAGLGAIDVLRRREAARFEGSRAVAEQARELRGAER